jgi:hypothetical protein
VRRHESGVQGALRQGSEDFVVIQFVKREDDTWMPSAPGGQQRLQRLTDRRHPDAQSKAPRLCRAITLAGPNHGIEGIETSPDLDHYVTARCREANSKGPALEDRDAKLILELGNAPADRRHFDAQRLRSARKAAGFNRD